MQRLLAAAKMVAELLPQNGGGCCALRARCPDADAATVADDDDADSNAARDDIDAGADTDDGTPLSAKVTVVMKFSIHCFDLNNHPHKTCFMQVFFNKGA